MGQLTLRILFDPASLPSLPLKRVVFSMKCPFCGNSDDRVLDTREQREGTLIRRRRECLRCKERFTTVESLQVNYPAIVKKDGRRESFSKEKILRGLQAACQKRPISLDRLESIVERISNWILARNEKEVPARDIGLKLIRELRVLDDVAYVRFASVYRSFQDVQGFVETLEDHESYQVYPEDPQQSTSIQLGLFSEKDVTNGNSSEAAAPSQGNGPQGIISDGV